MLGRDTKERPHSAVWTYLNPQGGFSKGTCQGLLVCAVLLGLLCLLVFAFGAQPSTPKAVVADVVTGLFVAVAGVWVVGGIFVLNSKVCDLSVKASGGVAIILFVAFYLRPMYLASGHVDYMESIEFGKEATMEILLDTYDGQFYRQEANAIHIVLPKPIREKVLNFRPAPLDQVPIYQANWGFPRRNPKLRILDQIERHQDCLSFNETHGKVIAHLDMAKLKSSPRTNEDRPIYLCDE